jgi:hypothetical protein
VSSSTHRAAVDGLADAACGPLKTSVVNAMSPMKLVMLGFSASS